MNPEWTEMVDASAQIRACLTGLDTELEYTVSSRWPRRGEDGNRITVTEITNAQTSICVVDNLGYQIDIWGTDRDAVVELAPLVNAALCGIGLRRDYAGPEEPAADGRYYRRTFRFARRVDKRTLRLVD